MCHQDGSIVLLPRPSAAFGTGTWVTADGGSWVKGGVLGLQWVGARRWCSVRCIDAQQMLQRAGAKVVLQPSREFGSPRDGTSVSWSWLLLLPTKVLLTLIQPRVLMSKVLLAKSITNIDLVKSIYGKSITRKSQMTQDAEDCDTDVKRRRCTQR